MDRIISSLLFASGIYKAKTKDLNLHLLSHPEYPNLRAITDTLDYFNIDNLAVKVSKSSFDQLPVIFLAHWHDGTQLEFVLVRKLKNKIKVTWESGVSKRLKTDEFLEYWDGTILAVEKNGDKKKSNSMYSIYGNLAIVSSVVSIVLGVIYYSSSWTVLSFSLFSFLGIVMSYVIQKEELGDGSSRIAKVCEAFNGNAKDCQQVLNSKYGKVFSFSLGDISMVYFTFLLSNFFVLGIDNHIIFFLSLSSLFAVVYTIYIQIFKLKSWCFLCLIISIILVSQFIILNFSNLNVLGFQEFIFSGSVLLMLIISLWYLIKGLWLSNSKISTIRGELLEFKKNKDFFFYSLAKNEASFPAYLKEKNKISFGNMSSGIVVKSITNPLCGFCKNSFEAVDSLLTKRGNDIRVDFIFNISEDVNHASNIIIGKVIELYSESKFEAYKALQFWFENKDLKVWTRKYVRGKQPELLTQKIIQKHILWCKMNNINYTPAIILNGSVFSQTNYDVNDIGFFIEDLKEAQSTIDDAKSNEVLNLSNA